MYALCVVLPDNNEAKVALKVMWLANLGRLVVQGLARYKAGHIIGERHTHFLAPDPDWMQGHEHGASRCNGFEYVGDMRFVQSPLDQRVTTEQQADLCERALHNIAQPILDSLLVTAPSDDAFGVEGAVALRRALSLRGPGPDHQLFVDPALRLALDQRLSTSES